jgi:hypothetical protein
MSKYLDAFEAYMRNSLEVARAEPNPHRRAILENYNRHAALEFSDLWQYIFTKQMTTDHPRYAVQLGIPLTVFDGLTEVKGFYTALNERVVWLQDEQLFVNDWGLASYSTFSQFVTGAEAQAEGHAVDDLDATYILTCPLAMFWPYDQNAKLIGEEVFQVAPFKLVKPDPKDVFTFDERKRMLSQYIGDLNDFEKHEKH